MSDTHFLARPDVTAFVEEVRRLLADLDDETRDELLGGLEADLTDQVTDGAELGDPATYAAELRSAAGLPERRRRLRGRLSSGSPVSLLDRARSRFDRTVARPHVAPAWEVVAALRPAWWVLRAWIAVTALDVAAGGWEPVSLVPSLGVPGLGALLLVVGTAVSALIGMGRLWPGTGERSSAARFTLLALNGVAVLAPLTWSIPMPAYLGSSAWDGGYNDYTQGYMDAQRQHKGLELDGSRVHNLFAYDADGRPVRGIRLVDQDGNPVTVRPEDSTTGRGDARRTGCPAWNGDTATYELFPLPEASLDRGLCDTRAEAATARRPPFPLASLPPLEGGRRQAGPDQGKSGR
ncbi:hypothetical protein [Nocardioides panacisoli]|uniref:DUF1707 domain-containing protein n=1 Tax=Nocardioides panacisoli TaxID=627624 RepID=A0ABP7IZ79_9ACTN